MQSTSTAQALPPAGEASASAVAAIAPTRAAEYGIPIFRLASSGISQAITADGATIATAHFPGYDATISARLQPAAATSRPLDRYFAPLCVLISFAILSVALFKRNVRPQIQKS
jgi:apolipoprotein N-acyltransferase